MCHLFLHFFPIFCSSAHLFVGAQLENQYQPNLSNQPYIHQSGSASINASSKAFTNPFISIEMCEDYMFRQTRNCARICQTLRPFSLFRATPAPTPAPAPTAAPTPPTPDSVSWLLVGARVCTVELLVVPLFWPDAAEAVFEAAALVWLPLWLLQRKRGV